MYRETLRHSESKERLGEVKKCFLRLRVTKICTVVQITILYICTIERSETHTHISYLPAGISNGLCEMKKCGGKV